MKHLSGRLVLFFTVASLTILPLMTARADTPVRYVGGNGSRKKQAIIIKGATEKTGVAAEYIYLAKHFPGYRQGDQSLVHEGKRSYDIQKFTTATGEKKILFFDITEFFGKLE